MTDLRRLVVMRHGKAEPYGASDRDRELTPRGVADCQDAGRHLAARGWVPELAVVSSAVRTRMTWQAMQEGLAARPREQVEDVLYHGDAEETLEPLQGIDPGIRTLAWVGHNPTVTSLGTLLDDGDGDPTAVTGLLGGFAAGALAVYEVEVPWAELGPGAGRLVDFYVGRS